MAREHVTKSDSYLVTWTVEPGEAGTRLDLFLKEKYRRLSREYLQRAIRDGNVTLNHQGSKPSQQLKVRDKVYVLSNNSGAEPPVDFDYKVLYEDSVILVVDKPGNLPVHPTGRYFFHTLLTQLRVQNGNEVDQKKEFYLVHRIDRETSGLLVVAKNPAAAADLTLQWEKKGVAKEYLAIVKGRVDKDRFEIDAPLGKDPHSEIKLKMNVVQMGASGEPLFLPKSEVLPSRTAVEVVERAGNYTVVRCVPHTGRQHQIRVHLWHVGHPIAGDKLYGPDDAFFLRTMKETVRVEVESGVELSRHALHAHKLSFRHPASGQDMTFTSPLPPELDEFLQKVRK
ncbi:MAG: RluA family pseudouridine synthase [Bdellovibrionota bacterium]